MIGDSLNDAEMFSEAQHTFAMKSGSERTAAAGGAYRRFRSPGHALVYRLQSE